jgi:branched-chain amino acid transport system permease protein
MEVTTVVELVLMGLGRGAIYALMALGLALIFGILNIPSFAQGEFYMVGTYFSWVGLSILGFGPLIALLIAAFATFLLGMCCEKAIFTPLRKSGGGEWLVNVFVLTLGLSLILQNVALVTAGPLYYGAPYFWGPGILELFGFRISYDRLMIIVLANTIILIFWAFLKRTRLGRAIRAVAQNATAASLTGVNLNRIYTITFGVGCMLSGIAGALMVAILPAYPTMGIIPLYKGWFVVIVAGLGTIGACIPIALLLGVMEAVGLVFASEGWQTVIYLIIICILLILKPFGVFGKGEVRGILEK